MDPRAQSSAAPAPAPRLLAALCAIARLATDDDASGRAAGVALTQTVRALGADSGCLLLLNPDTNRLELEAQHGLPDAAGPHGFEIGQGLPGWVALHGTPLLTPDVAAEPRYRQLRDGVRCQMCAPLLNDEQVLGVLVLDHDTAGGFGPDALADLLVLADETARVLRRLWQLDRLQGKARQLETLITIGRSLVGKLEPQELFDALARDAAQMLGSRAAALFLHHPAAGTVQCVALNATAAIVPPAGEIPADACLVGVTLRTCRQTEFGDVQSPEFHGLADVPDDPGLRSVLVTPLIYENEVLGALAVFSDRVHRFDNDAKRLSAALAGLGAVALQNTRLYARVFQSEETLRKNEQLTTLGLLAAEIAHEIRNPLTVLKLLHGGLGLDFAPDDPRHTDMRVIGEKLDQLEAIVLRVLQFAKAPASDLHSRWSLLDIVNDTLLLVRLKLAQSKITLQFDPPARAPVVEGHKGQLQQVLLNLLLNSTQAMPDGGTITLRLATERHPEGPRAVLDVADTGGGIAPALRDRIFDSFLSTRPDGTGLGLAIARRIMLSHHGDIQLVTTGPQGTTLRLSLPAKS